MKQHLYGIAHAVREAVWGAGIERTFRAGRSVGGDPQYPVDRVAEEAVSAYIREHGLRVALYSEDEGLIEFGPRPETLLVVDPIDGTRPAAAGLPLSCVSIVAAPMSESAVIADVRHALLLELGTGHSLYVGPDGVLQARGYDHRVPALSGVTSVETMFWTMEFNGHPARRMTAALGDLIDASASTGGLFTVNSACFSISRIVTGQLDAYVDIGNRILRDHPATEADFRRVGGGNILHLFPYDIAAAVKIAEAAGVIITDAYGRSLTSTRLTDLSPLNQRSCVAAATPELHRAIMAGIDWDAAGVTSPR
ncbi:inositol monophosphatase family protein [Bailinhaonella thermotolerans]|uniref:Myo-inositol-1(Or 4)-monophosphatase n=1 Tax=Bailinhaonella thermotolerans TaxID=1070861 RepID=A0A3A4AAV3_9ACTN|nr:inositol monophosphatase family protein [Bailinhaonella thermotolerans]RJL23180.1 hypothetical protein D5H75_32895 [Bailinhaonella thermotolerans]